MVLFVRIERYDISGDRLTYYNMTRGLGKANL